MELSKSSTPAKCIATELYRLLKFVPYEPIFKTSLFYSERHNSLTNQHQPVNWRQNSLQRYFAVNGTIDTTLL